MRIDFSVTKGRVVVSKTEFRIRSRVDGSARMAEGSSRWKMSLILVKHWLSRPKRQVSAGRERWPISTLRNPMDASMLAAEVSDRMEVRAHGDQLPWHRRFPELGREIWEEVILRIPSDYNRGRKRKIRAKNTMARTSKEKWMIPRGHIIFFAFISSTPGQAFRPCRLMAQARLTDGPGLVAACSLWQAKPRERSDLSPGSSRDGSVPANHYTKWLDEG
jgi:hypothetical protein